MTANALQLDIVSKESLLYSDTVERVFVTGSQGEIGIYPGHSQLLTTIKPGQVRVVKAGSDEDVYYVSGGLLEIQPHCVTILADMSLRAADIDEAAAEEARQRAERALHDKKAELDYTKVVLELSEAIAQIRAARRLRERMK